jgi:hypothetical protein
VRRAALAAAVLLGLTGAAAHARTSVFITFKTPSGNIGCGYSRFSGEPAFLRCDIRSGLHNPTLRRPPSCHFGFGFGVGMGKTGRAFPICAGDTVLDPRARVIRYGSAWTLDGFRCLSQTIGLRCTNTAGHGFFLSRERWQTF